MIEGNVVDLKVELKEFGSYLLGFQNSVLIKPNEWIEVGSFIRLFEYDLENKILTGRNLLFEILFVDKNHRTIDLKGCWICGLKKH